MPEDDHRSVIEACLCVFEAMDDAVERRVERRSGRHRHVHPDVYRASLVGHRARGERVGGVDQARFVVATDADLGTSLPHGRENPSREWLGGVVRGIAGDERAAGTEVEPKHRRRHVNRNP